MKTKFVIFECIPQEAAYGMDLPAAVIYRMDGQFLAELQTLAGQIKQGKLSSASLNASPESVRWLKQVGFSSEGDLACVPGPIGGEHWFDPDRDEIVYTNDAENMEMEEGRADFADACTLYEAAPVINSGVLVLARDGEAHIGCTGSARIGRENGDFESSLTEWGVFKRGLECEEALNPEIIQFDDGDVDLIKRGLEGLIHESMVSKADAKRVQAVLQKISQLPDAWATNAAPSPIETPSQQEAVDRHRG